MAGTQFSGAKFDPGIGKVGLFQQETSQIEMSSNEVAVQQERVLVGADGELRLLGAMIGQPKVIPRLRLFGQFFHRQF